MKLLEIAGSKNNNDQCFHRVRIQPFSEPKQLFSEVKISGRLWECLMLIEGRYETTAFLQQDYGMR